MTGSVVDRWVGRFRVYDLHRFFSLLTLGVTLFHVFVVLGDDYFRFSVADLLIPLASPYRPWFMAAGIIALYLSGLVIVTFYLRRLIPYSAWRLLHYSTFLTFVLILAHGIGGGSDSGQVWARYLYVGSALVVFNLLVYRLLMGSARGLRKRGITRASLPSARSLLDLP